MTSELYTHRQSTAITTACSTLKDSCPSDQQWMWNEYGVDLEPNFSIDPYLLIEISGLQDGQSSQYEGHSPYDAQRQFARDASIPVHEIRDEILWQELQPSSYQHRLEPSSRNQNNGQQDMVHIDASSRVVGTEIEANNEHTQSVLSARPLKRKRGRPRLDSYVIETQDVNSSPSQSSSARELHLEKNRVAAAKCRMRSKGNTINLVAQAKELTSKNKALKADEAILREQVLQLKHEVLRHAGCGSWAIDRYVARCAGGILGMEAPPLQTSVQRYSHLNQRPEHSLGITDDVAHKDRIQLVRSHSSMSSSIESDDCDMLQLLKTGDSTDGPYDWEYQQM